MENGTIFKCPKCGKEIKTYKYTTIYRGGNTININDETNKELICENCNIKLEFQIDKTKGFGFNYGRFSSLSIEERQNVLKKRSSDDAKKMKYKDQEREKVYYKG